MADKHLYDTGDSVGWTASRRHGAGTGIITQVLPQESGAAHYEVHKLIHGKATGEYLTVEEEVLYRTRSIWSDEPLPPQLQGR